MPPLDIEKAIALPADQCVEQLLQLPENQWFERKSGSIKPADLAIPLVAMANAEGGTVAVGLHNGKVTPVSEKADNDLRRTCNDFINPQMRCSIQPIDTSQGRVLIFQVQPAELVHETNRGDSYLRVGDRSIKLSFNQRRELEWDRPASSFEGNTRFLNLTVDSLDEELIRPFQERLQSKSIIDALYARDLITEDKKVRVAGYLLFSKRPQIHFPNAHIRVLKYAQDDRGSGRYQTLIDGADNRFEGSILTQLEEASKNIEELIPKRRAFADSGRFEAIPSIPRDAWYEGLVNAAIHRSYSDSGDHIRVEIFPNRIEITNPGRFLGTARLDDPESITRKARNPRIARVCNDLLITQELGEGIRRIFAEMRKVGLSDPVYQQRQNAVNLTLFASSAIPQSILNSLSPSAELILDQLRKSQQPLGTGQIAELIGISRPAAARNLKKLQDAGLVSWKGGSPNDPRATWSLC